MSGSTAPYSEDQDLVPLLRSASSNDIGVLARLLGTTHALPSSTRRPLRRLSGQAAAERGDKVDVRDVDAVVAALHQAGGNSIANLLRGGRGVRYAVIVRDVARRLRVKTRPGMEVAEIEKLVQARVLETAYERMTDDEQRQVLRAAGELYQGDLPRALPLVAALAAIRLGGNTAYFLALSAAGTVSRQLFGHALHWGAQSAVARSLALVAGPLGWGLTLGWTVFDMAGPAFRITVPCVLHIAYLRQTSNERREAAYAAAQDNPKL